MFSSACEKCRGEEQGEGGEGEEKSKILSTRAFTVERWPLCLVIQLLRFDNKGDKKTDQVSVPCTWQHMTKVQVNMQLKLAGADLKAVLDDQPTLEHNLSSVIVHKGANLDEGHYVTFKRRFDNTWWVQKWPPSVTMLAG